MISQLMHVFETYWRRPLCLLLAIPILAFAGMLLYSLCTEDVSQRQIGPNPKFAGRFEIMTNGQFNPPIVPGKENEVRRVWVNGNVDAATFTPNKLPQLEYLSWATQNVTLADAEFLLKFPHLHSLELACQQLSPGALVALGPQMIELQVPSFLLHAHLNELPALNQLTLLRTDQSQLSADTMAGIARIPNLRTLVLERGMFCGMPAGLRMQNVNEFGELNIAPAALEPLTLHPHLQAVFADWSQRLTGDRKLLASVHAYPASYRLKEVFANAPVFFMMLLVSALLVLQLGAQFLNPAAMVVPGYGRSHKLAAILIMVVSSSLCLLGLTSNGISILPAVAITLLSPAVISALICCIHFTPNTTARRYAFYPLLKVMAILSIAAFAFVVVNLLISVPPPMYLGMRTWFFAGHYPFATACIVCAELGILSYVALKLERLALDVLETNPAMIGFSISQLTAKQGVSRSGEGGWQLWGMDPRGRDLSYHGGLFWKQVLLLRSGNPYRPFQFQLVYLVVMGLMFPVFHYTFGNINRPEANPFQDIRSFIWSNTGQLVVMTLVIPISLWFRRRKSMEMEFCRPVDRQELSRQLFVGLAIDQSFAIIPAIAFTLYIFSLPQVEANTLTIACAAAFIVVLFSAGFAAGTTCFAFKPSWPIYLVTIIGFLGLTMTVGIGSATLVNPAMGPKVAPATLITGIAVITVCIWGSIFWLYRRTRNREWG